MANDTPGKNNPETEKGLSKPAPETLHTTDPQKNMEGPVSSLMHKTGEGFDTSETKDDADREKEEKM